MILTMISNYFLSKDFHLVLLEQQLTV